MKKVLSCVLLFLIPSVCEAESDVVVPKENWVLQLQIMEGDEKELDMEMLILAGGYQFQVEQVMETKDSDHPILLKFEGTLAPGGADNLCALEYRLSRQVPMASSSGKFSKSVSYREIGWSSAVLIPLGSEKVVMRMGDTEYKISISKEKQGDVKEGTGGGH